MHSLVSAPLWHHYNTADFFDLRIVRRTDTVQVASDLRWNDWKLRSELIITLLHGQTWRHAGQILLEGKGGGGGGYLIQKKH